MPLARFHDTLKRARSHTDDTAEHAAVIDLLVLTVYADRRVAQGELDALEQFDVDHADWDEKAFSILQYLPTAIAGVRNLRTPEDSDRFLVDAASRIVTPSLRAATVGYCRAMAEAGGSTEAESALVARIGEALA